MPLYHGRDFDVVAYKLAPETAKETAQWCDGFLVQEIDVEDPEKKYVGMNVLTAEGVKRASEGDYIVKGPLGFVVYKLYDFSREFNPAEKT